MLELDPAARLPPACQAYEKAISLGGMSKTFAMPGLRIGWLAMQDESLLKYVNLGPCVACADVIAGIVIVLRILSTCVPRLATALHRSKNSHLHVIVCPARRRIETYKDYTTICSSAPSEILSLIGLRNAEKVWPNTKSRS
jgi:hypothetical protein